MHKLKELVPGDPHFEHVCTKFASGIADNDWIPLLGEEGGWIVISADRASRGPKTGGKLPLLCYIHKITHVLLSGKLNGKRGNEKIAALSLVWSQITELYKEVPGTRFNLRYKETEKGVLSIVLQKAATQS